MLAAVWLEATIVAQPGQLQIMTPKQYLARLPCIIPGLTIDTSGGWRTVSCRETFRNGASPTLPIHHCCLMREAETREVPEAEYN
jgi:hypothetical protein